MRVCDELAKKHGLSWSYERKYKAYLTSLLVQNEEYLIFKSKWPMNLNGKSVERIGIYFFVIYSFVMLHFLWISSINLNVL